MWNEATEASLRGMWNSGMQARDIAEKLGFCTRNAVIGKARRLGLPEHSMSNAQRRLRSPNPPRNERQPMAKKANGQPVSKTPWRRAGTIHQPTIVDLAVFIVPMEQRIPLDEIWRLETDQCRYLIGDPKAGFWCNDESYYCGGKTDGGSYCPVHSEVVYNDRGANPAGSHRSPIQSRRVLLRGPEQPREPADGRF